MKTIFLNVVFLIFTTAAFGQSFYTSEKVVRELTSVELANSSSLFLVDYSNNIISVCKDATQSKVRLGCSTTDQDIWTLEYSTSFPSNVVQMITAPNNDILILLQGTSTDQFELLKIDQSGSLLGQVISSSNEDIIAKDFLVTDQNEVVVFGNKIQGFTSRLHIVSIPYNLSGLQSITLGSLGSQLAFSDIEHDGQNYFLGYHQLINSSIVNARLVKLSSIFGIESDIAINSACAIEELRDLKVANGKVFVASKFFQSANSDEQGMLSIYDVGNMAQTNQLVYPVHSRFNDVLIDVEGNVVIAGYYYDNARYGLLVKYAPDGTFIEQSKSIRMSNYLDVEGIGEMYFVCGEEHENGFTKKISTFFGNDLRQKNQLLEDPTISEATSRSCRIKVLGDLVLYDTEIELPNQQDYRVNMVSLMELDQTTISDGINSYASNQIWLKFNPKFIQNDYSSDKRIQFSTLNEIIGVNTAAFILQQTGWDIGKWRGVKIFRRWTESDSISIARNGDLVKMPKLSAYVTLQVPNGINLDSLTTDLLALSDIIEEGGKNLAIKFFDIPNDFYFGSQGGLEVSTDLVNFNAPANPSPNFTGELNGIQVVDAWDIQKGKDYVKVGVIDELIFQNHPDFLNNSSFGSVVIGGYDFYNFTPITGVIPFNNHGTKVAGIIGANRNNIGGIGGIAGGDVDNGVTGVQMVSLGVTASQSPPGTFVSNVAETIVEGSSNNQQTGFGYGCHLLNISGGTFGTDASEQPALMQLKASMDVAQKNQVTIIAAKGNSGTQNPPSYPASYDDELVLSVGASGGDGAHKDAFGGDYATFNVSLWESSFGFDMDVMAPGIPELVYTTSHVEPISGNGTDYEPFNGTSAAAPHVTGVSALMYSEHNPIVGAPNVLFPSDIENILQKTAIDKGVPNYDPENGHGLINAKAALEAVDFPECLVQHSGTPYLVENNLINTAFISLGTGVQYAADLNEIIVRYKILVPAGYQYIDGWHTPCVDEYGVNTNPLTFEEFLTIHQQPTYNPVTNEVTFALKTYLWEVNGIVTNDPFDPVQDIPEYWYPRDISEVGGGFSAHLKTTPLGVDEHEIDKLVLLPNPNNGEFWIRNGFEGNIMLDEIIDLSGKVVLEIDDTLNNGESTLISLNLVESGIYFVSYSYGDQKYVKRIVIQ